MTHILSNPEAVARAEAGRAAIEVCHQFDALTAADVLSGRMEGYVLACAEVIGWPDTLDLIAVLFERANLIHVPQGNA